MTGSYINYIVYNEKAKVNRLSHSRVRSSDRQN